MIQAIGGKFNLYAGTSSHLGAGKEWAGYPKRDLEPIDYPIGAGMIVGTKYFDKYGPMSTDYFLYYEEIDLIVLEYLLIYHQ